MKCRKGKIVLNVLVSYLLIMRAYKHIYDEELRCLHQACKAINEKCVTLV